MKCTDQTGKSFVEALPLRAEFQCRELSRQMTEAAAQRKAGEPASNQNQQDIKVVAK